MINRKKTFVIAITVVWVLSIIGTWVLKSIYNQIDATYSIIVVGLIATLYFSIIFLAIREPKKIAIADSE